LIGIVGYTPVLDCYPLGPRLMSKLERSVADRTDISIENMTWGPIHIVQRFQDPDVTTPKRLILVGSAATSRKPGKVQTYRWAGGPLPEQVIQERVYEAVTGIVDIENTLVIGDHFGIWPKDCFSIEVDMQADAFGRMVIADSEGWADDPARQQHLGFSPSGMIDGIVDHTLALVKNDGADIALRPKSATDLASISTFTHNRLVDNPDGDKQNEEVPS
ncbi:MAG: hypothetical protein ACR2QF_05215, partial [Geminicoccaceae bacterium]